jgi:hypothetical protein
MFSEPPCNLKMYVPRTGQMFHSILRTFKKHSILPVRKLLASFPETIGKPKMYIPTTSKEPNVLARMLFTCHFWVEITWKQL